LLVLKAMRLPIVLAIILILFTGLVFAQDLTWQIEGVVLTNPSAHKPTVILLSNGKYRMYFSDDSGIESAISQDAISFTLEKGVRLQGATPTIIKLPNGSWRMYFQTLENGKEILKSAASPDALKWTVEKGARLSPGGEFDPDGIANPSVISLPQGGYRMYYDGEIKKTEQEVVKRILSATSSDGVTWVKDPGVRINISEAPINAVSVWSAYAEYYELTKTYQIYFSAQKENLPSEIYLATSENGLLFNVSEEPQLTPGNNQSNSYQEPFLLTLPEAKRMYFVIGGSGIYSATLKEFQSGNTSQTPNLLESIIERLNLKKINLHLPENAELYIVPTILLVGGAIVLILLWRAHPRR